MRLWTQTVIGHKRYTGKQDLVWPKLAKDKGTHSGLIISCYFIIRCNEALQELLVPMDVDLHFLSAAFPVLPAESFL